jgi:hypothetical protein
MDFAEGLAAGKLRVIAMSRFGYLRPPLRLKRRRLRRPIGTPACSMHSASPRRPRWCFGRRAVVDAVRAAILGALHGAGPDGSRRLRAAARRRGVDEDSALDRVLFRHGA